jgi:hypothetical protein
VVAEEDYKRKGSPSTSSGQAKEEKKERKGRNLPNDW